MVFGHYPACRESSSPGRPFFYDPVVCIGYFLTSLIAMSNQRLFDWGAIAHFGVGGVLSTEIFQGSTEAKGKSKVKEMGKSKKKPKKEPVEE